MNSDIKGAINIGSDVIVNITDVAQKIIDIIGSKSKIDYALSEMFMTSLSIPEINKIKDKIGWMPITTVDNGLKKTINIIRTSKGIKGIENFVNN